MPSWVRNVMLLDLDEPDLVRGPVDLHVERGRIRSIVERAAEAGAPAPGEGVQARDADRRGIDGTGLIAMPGLVNAHLHSTGRLSRWAIPNLPLELFMLWEVPLAVGEPPPPELHRLRTLVQAADMIRSGITAVMDDPILSPPDDSSANAILGAYEETGLRATVGLYRPNLSPSRWLPHLGEVLPPDLRREMDGERDAWPPDDAFLALTDRLVDRWHRAAGGRLRVAMSCSSPSRCSDTYLDELHARAVDADAPFVFHLCESKTQRVAGQVRYGRSVVAHLRDRGILDARTVAVHAVWIDEDDAAVLGEGGATVVHSPAGNLRCGSGLMPWALLASARVPVALCTDEATVVESSSLWEVGGLAGMLHTLGDPDWTRWPDERDILRSMTTHGARAMGLAGEVGVLRPGAVADVILLEPPSDVDGGDGLARWLVYGDAGSCVRWVIVDGEVVAERGRIRTFDEEALRDGAREVTRRWGAVDPATSDTVTRLRPYLEEIYRRCMATEVGFTRLAPPDPDPGRTGAPSPSPSPRRPGEGS